MRTHPKARLSRSCRGCWCGCGSWRRRSRRCAAAGPGEESPAQRRWDPATRCPPRTQGKCASRAPGPRPRRGRPGCGCGCSAGARRPGPVLGALALGSHAGPIPPGRCLRSCYEACGGHGWCLISPKGRPFPPPRRPSLAPSLRSTWTAGRRHVLQAAPAPHRAGRPGPGVFTCDCSQVRWVLRSGTRGVPPHLRRLRPPPRLERLCHRGTLALALLCARRFLLAPVPVPHLLKCGSRERRALFPEGWCVLWPGQRGTLPGPAI